MEVILRDHVENVGKRGEVVKVADGYARNYLLPRKLALVATPGNLKQVERERVKLDLKEAHEKTAAEAIAARMANLEVVISRKVGESDVLYGSVTSADIAEAERPLTAMAVTSAPSSRVKATETRSTTYCKPPKRRSSAAP